jgi:hypothetical protein
MNRPSLTKGKAETARDGIKPKGMIRPSHTEGKAESA